MKPIEQIDRRRSGKLPILAAIVVAALLAGPTAQVYALGDAGATELSWLAQAEALWSGLWTAVADHFPNSLQSLTATDTTDTTTSTTDPPPDTSGDGGFDGGGGTGVYDPNGNFGI